MPDVNYLIDSYLKARYEEDEEEENEEYDPEWKIALYVKQKLIMRDIIL